MKPGSLALAIGGTCLVAGIAVYFSLKPSEIVVTDEPGGFAGIVVNGLTDEPIPDATVLAVQTAPANKNTLKTEHTKTGQFDLTLQDGSYLVSASAPGFTTMGRNDKGRDIEIEDKTRYVNAKLRLWPTSSIQGRVVAGNTGIQADIVLYYDNDASGAGDYEFQTVKADEDGHFVISDAFAGTTTVSIAAEGFASVDLRDTVISAGQTVDLGEIPLRDGVSLFGKITDAATRRGISNARIVIRDQDNSVIAETTSDHGGDFRLPATDIKQVAIQIDHEGYHAHNKTIQLTGNANKNYDIALQRAWGLTLNVQNQTGRDPIKTHIVIVDAISQKTVYDSTLANGTHNLDNIKGGPFIIEAETPDSLTKTHLRATSGDNVYVRLRPFGKINVIAKTSEGTELTQGEYRYFSRSTQTENETETPWTAFTSSEFEIADLQEGFYRVEIKSGKKEVGSHEIRIQNGDVYRLNLQLLEGGVLTGHVITELGNPVRATVTLSNDSRVVATDKDGYFTFDKMPAEPASISIVPRGRDSKETKFTDIVVKENDRVEREFRVVSPRTDDHAARRARMEEMRERGDFPPPPPRDGRPPWGDGPPPWGDGPPPAPPWGDGPPPWGDGPPPAPPWGDGPPPWGDGPPPWGDGPPPWANRNSNNANDNNGAQNNFAGEPPEIIGTPKSTGRKK